MNKPVQIIETVSGERLVVLPEADYQMLLAAAEEDEELRPEIADEIDRRSSDIAAGAKTVPFDQLRKR